jgi:hypothetical protein
MDPDTTLEALRRLMEDIHEGDEDILDSIVEHFQALDEWLSDGGLLPEDWDRG